MADFRKPTDGQHLLRSDVPFPPGVEQVWGFKGAKVVGVTHEGREQALEAFIASPHRHVLVEREPDNPHDPNAVRFVGIWLDQRGAPAVGVLGYLSREDAAILRERAGDQYLHGRVELMFLPGNEYGAGLRVGIGTSATLAPADVNLDWLPEPPSRKGGEDASRPPSRAPNKGGCASILVVVALLVATAAAALPPLVYGLVRSN